VVRGWRGLLGKVATNLFRDVQPRAMESGLDRGLFHAERCRHVGDGELHDLFEHERKAKILGKGRDGVFDRLPALSLFEKL